MKFKHVSPHPPVEELLHQLRDEPARDPEKVASGKASYLGSARKLRESTVTPRNPTPTREIHTRKRWRKDPRGMLKPAFTTLLVLGLLLGGTGITVAMAQAAQPEDMLYPVKLASEDVQVQFTSKPESQLELILGFTDRRNQEIKRQIGEGQTPTNKTADRYQQQVDDTLDLAAQLPRTEAILALTRIQAKLQAQNDEIHRIHHPQNPRTAEVLARVETMLHNQLQVVQNGLLDPQKFKAEHQMKKNAEGIGNPDTLTPAFSSEINLTTVVSGEDAWTSTPESDLRGGTADGNCAYCGTEKPGEGGNPWILGTPVPGNGPNSNCGKYMPEDLRNENCPDPATTQEKTKKPTQVSSNNDQIKEKTKVKDQEKNK